MKEVNFCINLTLHQGFLTLHPSNFTVQKFNPFHPKPILSLQEGCPYNHGPYKGVSLYVDWTILTPATEFCSDILFKTRVLFFILQA